MNKYILLLKENREKICYRIYIWHFLKKIGCFLNQNYNSALVDGGNKVEHIVTAPSQKGDDSLILPTIETAIMKNSARGGQF